MKVSANGLVIWEVKTGEADRVITILTERGVVSAYAKGSLRPKNKLTSPTAMLSYSNFELFSGKNMYTVDDALSKERFISLFSDMERYSLAVYFCELMKFLAPIEDDATEYLSLMLNSLFLLNEGKKDILLVKAVFELSVMSISGYMPDLTACNECGEFNAGKLYFNIADGIWLCESCANKLGKPINCSGTLLSAMRHVIYSEKGKIFSFDLGADALKQLNEMTSRFVVNHIDRTLTTLDFLSTILNQ